MKKNISLPLLSLIFKLNDLVQKINSLDISNSDRASIQQSINKVYNEINKVHSNRMRIVDEIHKIANSLGNNS